MNSRRALLKRLGLFGAGAGAFAIAPGVTAAVTLHTESNCNADGPICTETLGLHSGTKLRPTNSTSSFTLLEPYEEYKTVHMADSRDGNLWLKTENNVWKRIVTE